MNGQRQVQSGGTPRDKRATCKKQRIYCYQKTLFEGARVPQIGFEFVCASLARGIGFRLPLRSKDFSKSSLRFD
jgi:hypothetical protein